MDGATQLALMKRMLLLALVVGGGDDDASAGSDGSPDARVPLAACVDPEPGIICTVAGSGGVGYSGDDGPALDAELSLPQDALAEPDGGLLIVDWNNHRVRRLTTDGRIVHVAGRGELGGDLSDPASSDFNHPTNLIFDRNGEDLLVAAWHNSKVRSIDVDTGDVTENCGDGRRAYFGDDGPAASASFDLPTALAWSPDGRLFIMDQSNQVIRYVDAEGDVHRLAGNCIIDTPTPDGPGPCEIPTPCPGGSGKATCGDVAATCGLPCNTGYAGGTAATLRMAQPNLPPQAADPGGRMVFDGDGNLLWVDTESSLVRKLDTEGLDTVVAGSVPVGGVRQQGYSGDGGPATAATMNRPVDIALDGDGTIYVTDVGNHCVRAVDPAGIITTIVGVCGARGDDGDGGPATEAHLKLPYGIELAGDTLYVIDTGNARVRAVRLR